jgi:transcriptional regulator with XRE-family HTH domain
MSGDAVKAARERRRWTQEDLATATRYNQSFIRRLEGNRRPNTSGAALIKITRALDMSVDHLLRDAGIAEAPIAASPAAGRPAPHLARLHRIWEDLVPRDQDLLRQTTERLQVKTRRGKRPAMPRSLPDNSGAAPVPG